MRHSKTQERDMGIQSVFLFMWICLFSLILGNMAFHFGFSDSADASRFLSEHFSYQFDGALPFSQFLWNVIVFSRKEIVAVLLISLSFLITARCAFLCLVFAWRGFLFGFCGAYIIASMGYFDSFPQGCFFWCLFFARHVMILSVLLCFGAAVFSCRQKSDLQGKIMQILTVCGEIGLLVFINTVYFFVISTI